MTQSEWLGKFLINTEIKKTVKLEGEFKKIYELSRELIVKTGKLEWSELCEAMTKSGIKGGGMKIVNLIGEVKP